MDPDTNLLLLDVSSNADEAFGTPVKDRNEEIVVATKESLRQAETTEDLPVFPSTSPSSPAIEKGNSGSPTPDEKRHADQSALVALDLEARKNTIPKHYKRGQEPVGGAFIHLGKTGGSTLTSFLRNGCIHHMRKPCSVIANETIASRLITHYYHGKDT